MARTLGVVTNLQRRIPRLGAPSTVYETVGRGASFMPPKNKKKSATLRWKRQPRETGLRGVGQGPLGWDLYWGPNRLASVRVLWKGFSRVTDGWYFVAREDNLKIPHRNTCGERGVPAHVVRISCVSYVLEALRVAHPGYVFKGPTSVPGESRRTGEGA